VSEVEHETHHVLEGARARGLEVTRFVRANASSLLATGLEWVLVTGLVTWHLHYLWATSIGAVAGAVTDFLIKRHWAFVRGRVGSIRGEAARYVGASALSLGWNILIAYGLVDGLHVAAVPGVIIASIIVGLAWNYPVHRHFVFHDRPSPS
jgi:putative flippase GtrA